VLVAILVRWCMKQDKPKQAKEQKVNLVLAKQNADSTSVPALLEAAITGLASWLPLIPIIARTEPAVETKEAGVTSARTFSRLHRAGVGRVAAVKLCTELVRCIQDGVHDAEQGLNTSKLLAASGAVAWTVDAVVGFPGSNILHSRVTKLTTEVVRSGEQGCSLWTKRRCAAC
jgi:hypothetical protein